MSDYKLIWSYFSVLAKAFEERIDQSTLEGWREDGLFQGCPFECNNQYIIQGINQVKLWLDDMKKDNDFLSRLRQDYLQLFIGVPKPRAPLWGSYYLNDEKIIFHEKTGEVSEWYHRYGLMVPPEKGFPDDYIVYELSFITEMLEKQQSMVKSNRDEAAKEYSINIKKFVSEQMRSWIMQWREEVMLYSRTEYYRGLSNMVWGGIQFLENLEES